MSDFNGHFLVVKPFLFTFQHVTDVPFLVCERLKDSLNLGLPYSYLYPKKMGDTFTKMLNHSGGFFPHLAICWNVILSVLTWQFTVSLITTKTIVPQASSPCRVSVTWLNQWIRGNRVEGFENASLLLVLLLDFSFCDLSSWFIVGLGPSGVITWDPKWLPLAEKCGKIQMTWPGREQRSFNSRRFPWDI